MYNSNILVLYLLGRGEGRERVTDFAVFDLVCMKD